MRLSTTLCLYIARQMAASIGTVFLVVAVLLFMLDLVELGRRVSRSGDVRFVVAVEMALLHLPYLAQRAAPYAVLFGSLLGLARLARSHEIVVLGAAGVSTPQLLFPGVVVALLVGAFSVAVFSPFASATLAGYYELDNEHLRKRATSLATPRNGLWLRQTDPDGAAIIHATGIDQARAILRDVLIVRHGPGDRFIERIDAATADVRSDHWLLRGARISRPGHRNEIVDAWRLDTDLTLDRIRNSFAAPETQSFWDIPGFVASLDRAGFSSLRHRLHWHSMLASPVLYAGMVLIAALFSLRRSRRSGTARMLALGAACGVGFYVFADVVMAYGLNGQIPYVLAAWAPAVLAVLLGSTLLLHARQG